jgi:hypothetical protein
MRTKLKQAAAISGLLAMFSVILISCADESTSPRDASNPAEAGATQPAGQLQTQYAWVGKFHSDGLAYVYKKLEPLKGVSRAEQCKVALVAIKEFAKTFKKPSGQTGVTGEFVGDPCDTNASLAHVVPNQNGPSSRATLQGRLTEMGSVFDQHQSYQEAKDAIAAFDRDASQNLSAEQAALVVGAGSIGLSSIDYWSSNIPAWAALGTGRGSNAVSYTVSSQPSQRHDDDIPYCDKICSADVKTFVSSLLAGWFAGMFDIEASAMRAVAASVVAALFQ